MVRGIFFHYKYTKFLVFSTVKPLTLMSKTIKLSLIFILCYMLFLIVTTYAMSDDTIIINVIDYKPLFYFIIIVLSAIFKINVVKVSIQSSYLHLYLIFT